VCTVDVYGSRSMKPVHEFLISCCSGLPFSLSSSLSRAYPSMTSSIENFLLIHRFHFLSAFVFSQLINLCVKSCLSFSAHFPVIV
jgi:hypothetical protein